MTKILDQPTSSKQVSHTAVITECRRGVDTQSGYPVARLWQLPGGILHDLAVRYLDPLDRRSLCWANAALYRCLQHLVYEESVSRHIPLTRTVSAVRQVMREIELVKPEKRTAFRMALAAQTGKLPEALRKTAISIMLRAAHSEEEKAHIIKGVAPTLTPYIRGSEAFSCFDWEMELQGALWSTVVRMDGDPALIAAGALLSSCADAIIAPYPFCSMFRYAAEAKSSTAKAELLRGIVSSYAECSDVGKSARSVSHVDAWEQLWAAIVDLPDGSPRHKSLGMLACQSKELALQDPSKQWREMLDIADTMEDCDKIHIYRGMVTYLTTSPKETARVWFNELWERCAKLGWSRQGITLENFANAYLENSAFGRDELTKIVHTSVKHLPPVERLEPVRIAVWRIVGPQAFSSVLPDGCLTPAEQSMVINYCATSQDFNAPVAPLVEDMLRLPRSVIHWALAGILSRAGLVAEAGGKEWIDQTVLPIVEQIEPTNRTMVLCHLAALGCPGKEQFNPLRNIYPLLSKKAWDTVQQYIKELPATQRSDLLLAFCGTIEKGNESAWEWALAQTKSLPPYLRGPVLTELLVIESRGYNSNPTALSKILPMLWEVPRIYRAYPFHAAVKLREGLDALDSLKAFLNSLRLKLSLPSEDRG